MAKKSKLTKKQRLKYARPSSETVSSATPPVSASQAESKPAAQPAVTATKSQATVTSDGRDFRFVSGDLRRLGILITGLLALELVLWYLMTYTGLGDVVYNLLRV